ncbi:MAG: hypothetical protein GW886_13895 [Rhodobacterales bacterium]|nr:hypothetical protein [Rhodobacterales bacterium]NCT12824.1 hypothetical protein [Rhodobacterales bacterium]
MTRFLNISRTRPSVHVMGQAHLSAAAMPARSARVRVSREEISAIFSAELGYDRSSV